MLTLNMPCIQLLFPYLTFVFNWLWKLGLSFLLISLSKDSSPPMGAWRNGQGPRCIICWQIWEEKYGIYFTWMWYSSYSAWKITNPSVFRSHEELQGDIQIISWWCDYCKPDNIILFLVISSFPSFYHEMYFPLWLLFLGDSSWTRSWWWTKISFMPYSQVNLGLALSWARWISMLW